jgi:hypothetical protein
MNDIRYLSAYRARKALERDLSRDHRDPPVHPPVYPPGAWRMVLRAEIICADELDEHMLQVRQREIRELAENYAWTVTEWTEAIDEDPRDTGPSGSGSADDGQGDDGQGDGPDS